jgi:hypothetical protein
MRWPQIVPRWILSPRSRMSSAHHSMGILASFKLLSSSPCTWISGFSGPAKYVSYQKTKGHGKGHGHPRRLVLVKVLNVGIHPEKERNRRRPSISNTILLPLLIPPCGGHQVIPIENINTFPDQDMLNVISKPHGPR